MNDGPFRDEMLGDGRRKKKLKKMHSPPNTPARRNGRLGSGRIKLDAIDNRLEELLSKDTS